MDYSTFYNPNNNSSSSSTPILIPSSCTRRATNNSRNAKNNKGNNNNKAAGGVRLSTDPQSVAARERRHRISDRFKMLQSLIPGGAKLDTVSMLEQAIQYVKFLKTQIWLHEALINNNNNNNNNNNVTNNNNSNDIYNQDHYDHKFIINTTSSTTMNNDAYYYEQYCYALMYDCNNNIGNYEGDGGGCSVGEIEGDLDGCFHNPQEINMAAATNYRTIQLSNGCSFHVHGQQNM